MTINDLNQIEFHDQNFRGITLDFAQSRLVLELDLYNGIDSVTDDSEADYNEIKLIFSSISDFSSDNLNIDVFSDLDILSLFFQERDTKVYNAELAVSLGFSKFVFCVSFCFAEVEVVGTVPDISWFGEGPNPF